MAKRSSDIKANGTAVDEAPVVFSLGDEVIGALKVDSARRTRDARLMIEGWFVGEILLAVGDETLWLPSKITRHRRQDVAQSLQVDEPATGFGFRLECRLDAQDQPTKIELNAEIQEAQHTGRFLFSLTAEAPDGAARPQLIKPVGFIESALLCGLTGDTVVVGWLVSSPDTEVALETESGEVYPLADVSYRYDRRDVWDTHGGVYGNAARNAAFLARVPGVLGGERIHLAARFGGKRYVVSTAGTTSLPISPLGAAKALFSISTAQADFGRRATLIDGPVLERLIEAQQADWVNQEVQERQLGTPPAEPEASIIVPLYGRTDFIEHQLIEFSRDPWFAAHAELIYVVDDPTLLEAFILSAEALHRLYRIPFKWVWGGVNRGFSGANNLGVAHARAPWLVFLNSDAFPRTPGWVPELLSVLKADSGIGAVGPRLLFGDGSIQHAGMEFLRREELGVWINHHPWRGLEPALDPAEGLKRVSAVTGACLAISRSCFDQIGGWDTGYLIGDFEDSDLCLKLRDRGFSIAYLPTVELTHLERQSFRLLGEGHFRTSVVLFNALRHQRRWSHLLETA